ncbi:MAG: mononuclear molybdenum enzyme YedY [Chloroflexi bacterium RBG_13_56_8]|nr:MAG: mononuclear molybdenum enzyme YedY [Chloroflexi bacterium RBG_13_56_8]
MRIIRPSEITPLHVFLNRRQFMVGVGALAVGSALMACAGEGGLPTPTRRPRATPTNPPQAVPSNTPDSRPPHTSTNVDDLGDPLTSYESVTGFNNYYEFTLEKSGVGDFTSRFRTSPWSVEVRGLVSNPKTFDIDDLRKLGQEERIYRMRCVEGWSMVIPWEGFPLHKLLAIVEPTSQAKYVRFETIYAPDQMPGQQSDDFAWPYVEGLRLDEAMHDLTILATGIYGLPLTAQNGAPIRLVVPWKYGFKSIKSIVKIELVEEMPISLWMAYSSFEYGFYANVNPKVPHPRWSQTTERRIDDGGRRETLLFNGYEEEVAHLYANMDLKVNF